VSRFTTTLARILERRNLTKSDLARTMNVSPATVGDYLSEEIAVTAKNFAKILRGVSNPSDQVELLLSHLADQVPPELEGKVLIDAHPSGDDSVEVEEQPASAWQIKLLELLGELPSRQRNDIIRLVERLRDDTQLRDLLNRTLDYIGDEQARVHRRQRRQLRGST
jgi:transcriptional regulator with XRE-family HTH domain